MTDATETNAAPLPLALAALDMLIDMDGETARIARNLRRSLSIIVHAATELHATMGEAIERHIYDDDNGQTQPADCQFQAAMDGLAQAFQGSWHNYAEPAAPLPWSIVCGDRMAYAQAADGSCPMTIKRPEFDTEDAWKQAVQNLNAIVAAVNARPTIQMTPEIAVIVDDGLIQDIMQRNTAPARVLIVDYYEDDEDMTELPLLPCPHVDDDKVRRNAAAFLHPLTDLSNAEFWQGINDSAKAWSRDPW